VIALYRTIESSLPRVDLKVIPGQPSEELTEDNAYTGRYTRAVYRVIRRHSENEALYVLWSLEEVECEN
jgi:hypothetical protein